MRKNSLLIRLKVAIWFAVGVKEKPTWTLTCPKCDGIFFKRTENSQTKSSYNATFICNTCGTVITETQLY